MVVMSKQRIAVMSAGADSEHVGSSEYHFIL